MRGYKGQFDGCRLGSNLLITYREWQYVETDIGRAIIDPNVIINAERNSKNIVESLLSRMMEG